MAKKKWPRENDQGKMTKGKCPRENDSEGKNSQEKMAKEKRLRKKWPRKNGRGKICQGKNGKGKGEEGGMDGGALNSTIF